MKCATCGESAYIYKEFTDDGKAVLRCLRLTCRWTSEPIERHIVQDVSLFKDKKDQWQ